ncbi:retrotransposon protein [Cucumis melo var. makuwa]|uniref:Retrotransposon protein n=1 Tax=Cucumis melo var. makuwa TaxID=1194695 RepID=A0A5D3BT63_CUCMM|nr:retrotransposon protein [Cucumis melo var. makuwa]TYK02657.1 retrotransposon protein [Cucumis melo var. makuwa]
MDEHEFASLLNAFVTSQRQCSVSPEYENGQKCFAILCHLLRTIAGLTSTEVVDVEEMVAMFLHIVANGVKNCVIQWKFMRSSETIFSHFNMVLLTVIRLHDELLKKPQPVNSDCTDQRWRWFEVPISLQLRALDGTYIKVNVPASDRARLRRISYGLTHPPCDILIACNVITGYYYLDDVGYPNADGILAPYRGQCYHLQE